ncbi:DUF1515 domain-containing protein [Rhizobium leguminosarum]|uniref:DUF1515 domain-containing protein n=1 Tax=Rhizobium leguminosarum TaxID=384 RepID=UPI00293DF53C|nr:DUF1515 domain-containing protein [Rhizobium leguminosarum]MDV4166177.1 DUF1515 domain-containing protein [Rhizobium leguminosarum]
MASLNDIMHALGRVQEGVDRLREDFGDEKRSAHESRAVIHNRLDDQTGKIGHLETTVAISGGVDAQLRDQIAELRKIVAENHEAVQPALEEWRRMKSIGIGISGLIAFAGLTIGGIITYVGDGAVTAIRHWLKIN